MNLTVLFRIGRLCQFAAVAVMLIGLLPGLILIIQSRNVEHLDYLDEIYLHHRMLSSSVIILVGIATGSILLWLGSYLKAKSNPGQQTQNAE